MTTWPSSSAASSSPPDFTAHALSRPPRKKPEPFSQPGRQAEHDQQKLRNTRSHVPESSDQRGRWPELEGPRERAVATAGEVLAAAFAWRAGPGRSGKVSWHR